MHHLKYLLFLLLLFSFHLARTQHSSASKTLSQAKKFLCLKPIGKKIILAMDKDNTDILHQLQLYICKNNPHADSERTEFRQLILGLGDHAIKNQYHLSAEFYNSAIDNYNNICQILDYLNRQNIPPSFLMISEGFYLQQIRKNEKSFRFDVVAYSFRKNYNRHNLVKTGALPIHKNEAVMHTTHNQLEKILTQFSPHFSLLSIKKQIKYQKQIQCINPWIESFRKGITFNSSRETFIIDDELFLLIPE